MSSPSTPSAPGAEGVAAGIASWQTELANLGGPNTLLWQDTGAALDITHSHPGGLAKLLAGKVARLSELYREPTAQTRAFADAAAIRDKELELEREHGIPGCYLAIGRATWTERRGPVPSAPVFLRRCALRPQDATGSEVDIVVTGQLTFNPVLRAFLESIGGTEISFEVLVRMSLRPSGFDPTSAYEALRRAWAGPPGWRVTPDLWITTFPFAKLAALEDFRARRQAFAEHPVIGALAAGAQGPVAPARVHAPIDPELTTVLDADPSQIAVIDAVRAGRTAVIDSGPGTGKSQTIVNVVADLARSGRSSLVVAASAGSRAAITGRLQHLGLGHVVFDVAAKASRPRPVLSSAAARPQSDFSSAGRELREHAIAMHRLREPWEVTLDELQERIAALCAVPQAPRSKVRIDAEVLSGLSQAAMRTWAADLQGLAAEGAWQGGEDDPWWGARVTSALDVAGARTSLEALAPAAMDRMQDTVAEVFAGVSAPPRSSLREHADFIAGMTGISQVLERFRLGIFDAPLELWMQDSGAVERWRHHRAIKALLRPGVPPADVDPLVKRALEVRPLWQVVRGSQIMPGQVLGLERARAAVDELLGHAQRLGALLPGEPVLAAEPLPALRERVATLTENAQRLSVLGDVAEEMTRARAAGLGPLLDDFAARGVPPELVPAEVEFVWLASLLGQITAADPVYARSAGETIRAAATRFRESDRSRQRATAAGLAAERAGSEPLVWVCGPHTLALHLPPERTFDLVVVDDAGALPLAASVAALARAGQALIVGDRLMPGPTPFTATSGGLPPAPARGPSLLEAAAAVWPPYRLAWHYRSHDARLIEWVNRDVYADAMGVFPSPGDGGALRLERVAAAESDAPLITAAVRAALLHARLRPKESLAVVTVDAALAVGIDRALGAAIDSSVGEFFAEAGTEPVVVLDAARATGMVRDAVLLVLGAEAAAQAGSPDGPRLLAAALTRARSRLTIIHGFEVSALTSSAQARPDREGLRLLADAVGKDRPAQRAIVVSALAQDLSRRLQARGLRVRAGVAPGMVDLAVTDPFSRGGAALAVQIDGPAYVGLGGPRMRDRIVYEQLRRLRWRPLRILTVDLFRDPAREEARIVAAVERLSSGQLDTGPVRTRHRGPRRATSAATGTAHTEGGGDPARGQSAAGTGRARVAPEQTRDDTDAGWGESPRESSHDRWLQENRPPHWG